MQPSTPRAAARVTPAAIVTSRRQGARISPPDLLAEMPEEHQRRGDLTEHCFNNQLQVAAVQMWVAGRQVRDEIRSGHRSDPRAAAGRLPLSPVTVTSLSRLD